MIPSARILIRSSAPPENMLAKPRIVPWFWLNSAASCFGIYPRQRNMCSDAINDNCQQYKAQASEKLT